MKKTTFLAVFLCTCITPLLAQNESKVIGGNNANVGDYPWMGSLTIQGGIQGCGASLIAPEWLLTAGHCIIDYPGYSNEAVILNSLVTDPNALEPFSELILIEETFVHEDYSIYNFSGPDIALIKLSTPSSITPIELADFSDSASYAHLEPAKVLGWGLTENGSNADSLLVGDCLFINNDTCSVMYQSSTQSPNFHQINPNGTICAGYTQGMTPVGGAVGDSGGPLFFEDNGVYKQVGVVSGGESSITTLEFPGIYTLVPIYRDWIDSVMIANQTTISVDFANANTLSIHYYHNNQVKLKGMNAADTYEVNIYTISGQNLGATTTIQGNSIYEIPVHNLQSGVYVITIHDLSQKQFFNQKIIVD